MKLYLDDNHSGAILASLLKKAGHIVVRPVDIQIDLAADARHLEFAIRNDLIVLTGDRQDFWDLNDLISAAGGHHPGILLIRFDNDRTRDMRPKHIVTAVGKLERSGFDVRNQITILNQWR